MLSPTDSPGAVWYGIHGEMESAIPRENAIKAWKRMWKIELIESTDPEWRDLHSDILSRRSNATAKGFLLSQE